MPDTKPKIKKADPKVGARMYRNGQRNNVFTIRSIDKRPGLAAGGGEYELYQDNGASQQVFWYTLPVIRSKFTLL